MDYQKKEFIGGKWADREELYEKKVSKAMIVSETNPEPSNYKDKDGNPQMQDVCKCRFPKEYGYDEALKIALNGATINGLVDAFGPKSADWQGKVLRVEIDKVPGKKFYMFFIPEGYKRIEDEAGYSKVVKIGSDAEKQSANGKDFDDGFGDAAAAVHSGVVEKKLDKNFDDVPF